MIRMKPKAMAGLLDGTILEEEIALESTAVEDGIKRYRKLAAEAMRRGEGAGLKPAERLMLHWFEVLSMAFHNEAEECRKGIPGRLRQITGPFLLMPENPDEAAENPAYRVMITPEQLAVIVMYESMNACMATPEGVRRSTLACNIGRAVFAEINLKLFRRDKSGREALAELNRRIKRKTPQRVNWWANKNLGENAVHDTLAKAHIGGFMLEKLLTSASSADYDWKHWKETFIPAFVQETRWESKKRQATYVVLTNEAWEIIDQGNAARETMRPRYLPMIVPPYPWTKEYEGGYVQIRTPFFSRPSQRQKRALDAADLTQIHECLTAVCSPGWRVNRKVLDVAKEIWRTGGGMMHIPPANPRDMPPRETSDDPALIRKAKLARAEIYRANVADRSARVEFERKLQIADLFLNRKAMYYPHQLDFRGRCYPIPPHLQHQSDDVARGLLEFAEAKDPGDDGMDWLKVHAANCYGLSKLSFEDRIQWVDDNMKAVLASAADPLDTDFWRHADESRPGKCDGSPWQFLAACIAIADPAAGAHAQTQMDGTCNGLQHYSALGRDPIGAAAVNLVPGKRPADVYQLVANAVKLTVQADCTNSQTMKFSIYPDEGLPYTVHVPISKLATRIVDLISRRVVKQPVMTSVYGVTDVGANEQVRNRLEELGLEGQELKQCSRYLAKTTLAGIGTVCAAATEIMDWLFECSSIIAKSGRPVAWTTPLGLPVVQSYLKWRRHSIATSAGQLTLGRDDDSVPVAVGEQTDGTAPNFVHSIDATHMFMTARQAYRAGITMASVHDGFITHAGTYRQVAKFARQQFVELHSRPILQDLHAEFQKTNTDIKIPPPPPPGDFDIRQVLDSPYLFS